MKSMVKSLLVFSSLVLLSAVATAHVQQVKTQKELDSIFTAHRLTVVDFFAKWCGPCKAFGPKFDKLSAQYSDVAFVKIDVDAAEALTAKYDIRSMPTVVIFKGSERVTSFDGDIKAIENAIKKHNK